MSRKKTRKKAQFARYSNCFEAAEAPARSWRKDFFKQDGPLVLELGCGHGEWSLEMARRYPTHNFLGVDLKADRMRRSAGPALEQGIHNLAFLRIHLLQLDTMVGEGEADAIWITFPDPFPKKRQAKHRMINPPFLEIYQKVLRPGGRLHLKTDNRDLFYYTLELFVKGGYIRFHTLSFDLHVDEEIGPDPRILTAYERDFLQEGKPTHYLEFSFAG